MKSIGNRIRFLILFSAIVGWLFALPASSHDPITTSVTFNKEVVRILQRNCLSCHSPGHIKSEISLTTFEEARPWAKAIKEEILEKRMPPYQAIKGFGDFQHSYLLPQRDVELIVSWVEGGAPRGDEKDFPKDIIAPSDWTFGKPNLILQATAPVKIPAGSGEITKCLTLPISLKTDRWVRAFEFRPGNSGIVQSAEIFLTRSGSAAKTCPQSSGLEKIGNWVPGQAVITWPENVGILVPARSGLVLKIRYRREAAPALDQSTLGLYLSFDDAEIEKELKQVFVTGKSTLIQAGTKDQRFRASQIFQEPTELIAIRPRLFPLAKSFEATAFYPDGTVEILIAAQNYRFAWEPSYFFKRPINLPVGSRLEVTTYFDNSDENQNLKTAPRPMKFDMPICELTIAK